MKKFLDRLSNTAAATSHSAPVSETDLPNVKPDMGLADATAGGGPKKQRLTAISKRLFHRLQGSDSGLISGGSRSYASGTVCSSANTLGPSKYFGVPLQELLANEDHIPDVLRFLVEYLSQPIPASCEGIFRLAGSSKTVKEIRERLDKTNLASLDMNDFRFDINAVASVLKQLIRELPGGLINGDNYTEFMAAGESVELLRQAGSRLPPANYWVMRYLLALCVRVAQYDAVNRMGPSNLAVVWAPNFFLAPGKQQSQLGSMSEVVDSVRLSTVVMSMIENYEAIFIPMHPLTVSECKILGRQLSHDANAKANANSNADVDADVDGDTIFASESNQDEVLEHGVQQQEQQKGPIEMAAEAAEQAQLDGGRTAAYDDQHAVNHSPHVNEGAAVQFLLDELKSRIDSVSPTSPCAEEETAGKGGTAYDAEKSPAVSPKYSEILKEIKRSRQSSFNSQSPSVIIHDSPSSSALDSPTIPVARKRVQTAAQSSTRCNNDGDNNYQKSLQLNRVQSSDNNSTVVNSSFDSPAPSSLGRERKMSAAKSMGNISPSNQSNSPRDGALPRSIIKQYAGSMNAIGSPTKTVRFSLHNDTVKFDVTSDSNSSGSRSTNHSVASPPSDSISRRIITSPPPDQRSTRITTNTTSDGGINSAIKDPSVANSIETTSIRLQDTIDRIQRINDSIEQPVEAVGKNQHFSSNCDQVRTVANSDRVGSHQSITQSGSIYSKDVLKMLNTVALSRQHKRHRPQDGGESFYSDNDDEEYSDQKDEVPSSSTTSCNPTPRPPQRPAPSPPALQLASVDVNYTASSTSSATGRETLNRPPLKVLTSAESINKGRTGSGKANSSSQSLQLPQKAADKNKNHISITTTTTTTTTSTTQPIDTAASITSPPTAGIFDPTNLPPIEFDPSRPARSLPSAERNRLHLLVRSVHRELQQYVEYLQSVKSVIGRPEDVDYSDKLTYYREEYQAFLSRRRLFEALKAYVKKSPPSAGNKKSQIAARTAGNNNIGHISSVSELNAVAPTPGALDPMTPVSPRTDRPTLERLKHLLKKEIAAVKQIMENQQAKMSEDQLNSARETLKEYYERYRQVKSLLDAYNTALIQVTPLMPPPPPPAYETPAHTTASSLSGIVNPLPPTGVATNKSQPAARQDENRLKMELIQGLRREKRQLQQVLLEYQQRFQREHGGRAVQTPEDRHPIADKYERYQEVKRKLQELQPA